LLLVVSAACWSDCWTFSCSEMERLNQFMESFSSLDILKLELKEELAVG
jgi:hypothetical protein